MKMYITKKISNEELVCDICDKIVDDELYNLLDRNRCWDCAVKRLVEQKECNAEIIKDYKDSAKVYKEENKEILTLLKFLNSIEGNK